MKPEFKNIENHLNTLKVLSNTKKRIRNSILSKADKNLVQAICECVDNALQGNINIPEDNLQKLKKYKHSCRRLLKKSSLKNKKKILIQHGGFLQYLLPAIITSVSSIISSLINKNE